MSTAQHKALVRHRRRQRARGLVRVEVEAPATDAPLIREVAAALRGDPERARGLRDQLREGLRPGERSILDLLACDLPDDVVDAVLTRPHDFPREVDL